MEKNVHFTWIFLLHPDFELVHCGIPCEVSVKYNSHRKQNQGHVFNFILFKHGLAGVSQFLTWFRLLMVVIMLSDFVTFCNNIAKCNDAKCNTRLIAQSVYAFPGNGRANIIDRICLALLFLLLFHPATVHISFPSTEIIRVRWGGAGLPYQFFSHDAQQNGTQVATQYTKIFWSLLCVGEKVIWSDWMRHSLWGWVMKQAAERSARGEERYAAPGPDSHYGTGPPPGWRINRRCCERSGLRKTRTKRAGWTFIHRIQWILMNS